MMNARIGTVGDLRHLLRNASDDTPLEVAAAPDVSGWTQKLLMIKHEDDDGVILALSEESVAERDLSFFAENTGDPVRPV